MYVSLYNFFLLQINIYIYHTKLNLHQTLQNKILKIVYKNTFDVYGYPLNIEQLFTLESTYFHYNYLMTSYLTSTSRTRNKNLLLPKINKTIYFKNSKINALTTFNKLPNELKSIENQRVKKKLKDWIRQNL